MLHPDPIIQEVIDIWLPRFLAAGIEIGDIEATTVRMTTWHDWCPEWTATAEIHEALGEESLAAGHQSTGVAEMHTAAKCYHLSYFLSVSDVAAHEHGLSKMVECFDRASSYESPAVEKIEIPFEDTHILGLFSKPARVERPPVVIVLPGLDSTKETRHSGRHSLLRRGAAVLSLDGPGQGEVSLRLPIRADYEAATAATIDYLESRGDVDVDRIGVNGASLGGYYAARVAALEPRVKATIANCGPYDWGECFDDLPIVTREAYRHYSGATTMDEARAKASELNLRGLSVSSPLYVIQGELDPLIPVSHGERIAGMATGEVVYNLVSGGNHGVNNLRYRAFPPATDWLLDRL
ncbi:MAG: esterase FrsA [Acidimicrobiia bacterium]|nr:esterase FrsA [Acidimicrobiia bacterium]MDH5293036.1 esterase FrsA [Acidimicrobiia bacterium]